MERWAVIEDFPTYEVSDQGRIRNGHTGREVRSHDNGRGILQVVLRRDGRSFGRAVHPIVATTFVHPGMPGDVPLHENGDRRDNRASNLRWVPLSFANQWTRQLHQVIPRDRRPVRHIKTGIVYPNSLECAKDIGGLEELVILTAQSLWETTYKGSRFEFVV